jgi:hypothetical protein
MKTMTTTMAKDQLIEKREQLRRNINNINQEIRGIEDLEKPYVAAISASNGGGETRFETEEQARKKLKEYTNKDIYRGGVSYGAFLYKYNDDGSKSLLDVQPITQDDFYPYQFDQETSDLAG